MNLHLGPVQQSRYAPAPHAVTFHAPPRFSKNTRGAPRLRTSPAATTPFNPSNRSAANHVAPALNSRTRKISKSKGPTTAPPADTRNTAPARTVTTCSVGSKSSGNFPNKYGITKPFSYRAAPIPKTTSNSAQPPARIRFTNSTGPGAMSTPVITSAAHNPRNPASSFPATTRRKSPKKRTKSPAASSPGRKYRRRPAANNPPPASNPKNCLTDKAISNRKSHQIARRMQVQLLHQPAAVRLHCVNTQA